MSGAECVRGTLVWRYFIWMTWLEIKSRHPIIKDNAGAVDDNATTETFVHTLNHRHPVPLIVCSCDVSCVFAGLGGNPRSG